MAERIEFIPRDLISELRPAYPFREMAWVLGSTSPDFTQALLARGMQPPEPPDLGEVLSQDRSVVGVEAYLTRSCALDCAGCSVPQFVRWAKEEKVGGQEGGGQLEAWEGIINELSGFGVKAVKFIGGEVGTIPWLAEIAGYAVRKGLEASVFTDGVPFLNDPEKLLKVMEATNGKALWMTSVDFASSGEELKAKAGRDEKLARRFKAERGLDFIEKVIEQRGHVIGHMMIHKPNVGLIETVYREVTDRGAMFSVGTMQVVHLYQGRSPRDYTEAVDVSYSPQIEEQLRMLVEIEDENVRAGKRTIANSRAHLLTTHSVGITQDIGCSDPRIGPPGVFAIMPNGTLRGCPVVTTFNQIRKCPGCAYAVFRDGDPRWADYLRDTGLYVPEAGKTDFPSLFYPTSKNNFLTYAS